MFRQGKPTKTIHEYVEESLTKYQQEYGGVAQLGEHLPCKQGVRSSILLISTRATFAAKQQSVAILFKRFKRSVKNLNIKRKLYLEN